MSLFVLFIGNLICVVAFNGFLLPNNLLSGGVTGIAIMLHYITDINVGLMILLINIPIFLLGAKFIDRKFAIYSLISVVTFSILLDVTSFISGMVALDDILIETVIGGLLVGIGMGTLFRFRISQGGLDIIAAILRKRMNVSMGSVLMITNVFILAIAAFLFGLTLAIYTLVGLYVSYQAIDKIQLGLDKKKTAMIITDKWESVSKEIFSKLNRGVTYIKGEGAYSAKDKKIILCTLNPTQVGKLKAIVEKVDAKAFIMINDTQEVMGRGFKKSGL